jgi:hypothetical protein
MGEFVSKLLVLWKDIYNKTTILNNFNCFVYERFDEWFDIGFIYL